MVLWTLIQLVQRSVLGDLQNLTGCSPRQSAPAEAAVSEAVGLDDLQRLLLTLAVLG